MVYTYIYFPKAAHVREENFRKKSTFVCGCLQKKKNKKKPCSFSLTPHPHSEIEIVGSEQRREEEEKSL